MGDVFRQQIKRYVDANGKRVKKDTPGARTVEEESSKWYGEYRDENDQWVRVPLSTDKTAAQVMLADLIRDAERARRGLADPARESHARRKLVEHLADWQAALLADGATGQHVRQTVACVRRVLDGCKFVFLADLSASAVQKYLARLRDAGRTLPPLDPVKAWYTKKELAAVLGVKLPAIPPMVRRHRLEATGKGKKRRFPKATAEALYALRTRGRSIKTSNLYLDALKAFVAWMVRGKRAADNPLAHLSGGNVKLDRRHDRQTLSEDQLSAILRAALASEKTFRGLDGPDRHFLYLAAMTTGFRAEEVASLTPESFALDETPPSLSCLPA